MCTPRNCSPGNLQIWNSGAPPVMTHTSRPVAIPVAGKSLSHNEKRRGVECARNFSENLFWGGQGEVESMANIHRDKIML